MKFLKKKTDEMTGIELILWVVLYSFAWIFSTGLGFVSIYKIYERHVEHKKEKFKEEGDNLIQ